MQLLALQALHGDIAQSSRERVLKRFRDGKTLVLVATDVAARGLDIPHVDLVVHYELPNVSVAWFSQPDRPRVEGADQLLLRSRSCKAFAGLVALALVPDHAMGRPAEPCLCGLHC